MPVGLSEEVLQELVRLSDCGDRPPWRSGSMVEAVTICRATASFWYAGTMIERKTFTSRGTVA